MQEAKQRQTELRRELNKIDLELELLPIMSQEYKEKSRELEEVEQEYAQVTKQVVMAKFL